VPLVRGNPLLLDTSLTSLFSWLDGTKGSTSGEFNLLESFSWIDASMDSLVGLSLMVALPAVFRSIAAGSCDPGSKPRGSGVTATGGSVTGSVGSGVTATDGSVTGSVGSGVTATGGGGIGSVISGVGSISATGVSTQASFTSGVVGSSPTNFPRGSLVRRLVMVI